MSSDWPCKNCKHTRADHGFIKPGEVRALHTACRVPDAEGIDYIDGCSEFIPIDNLIYLEQKENRVNPDWPCRCRHGEKDHGQVYGRDGIARVCFNGCTILGGTSLGRYLDDCGTYIAQTNLEYLENKSK